VELPLSDQGLASQKTPEPVVSGAAVARGRVYFVSSDTLYVIGPKRTTAPAWTPVAPRMEAGQGPATWLQVAPTEMVLKPGETVHRRQAASSRTGWAKGAGKSSHRYSVQAHARVHGAHGLVKLYGGGRHSHQREAPANGRRRHHRAALYAVRVRQQWKAGDER